MKTEEEIRERLESYEENIVKTGFLIPFLTPSQWPLWIKYNKAVDELKWVLEK